jgi:hypothetical protein
MYLVALNMRPEANPQLSTHVEHGIAVFLDDSSIQDHGWCGKVGEFLANILVRQQGLRGEGVVLHRYDVHIFVLSPRNELGTMSKVLREVLARGVSEEARVV